MTKTIVVIQGRVKHKGGGPIPTPDGFDSSRYIQENIRSAMTRGHIIRFLAWEDEDKNKIEEITNQFKNKLDFRVQEVPIISSHDTKYIVLKSFYDAILNDETITKDQKILKLRTDQLMPDTFWDWLSNFDTSEQIQKEKFFVSELSNLTGYIGDFIFLGKKKVLSSEIKKYIDYGDISLHPGNSDIGYKMILNKSRNFLITKKQIRNNWISYVEQNVRVVPKEIYKKFEWRGKLIQDIIDTEKFNFDSNISKKNYKFEDLKSLIYVYKIFKLRGYKKTYILELAVYTQLLVDFIIALRKKLKNYSPLGRKKIFARVACFGRLIIEDRNLIRNANVENFQKGRIDFLVEVLKEKSRYASLSDIDSYFQSRELLDFQKQNIKLKKVDFSKIDIFIMDTFSDLTDIKFILNSNSSYFYSHRGDILQSVFNDGEVKPLSLLKLEQLEEYYLEFIHEVRLLNSNSYFIFIHYPYKFETREAYINRALYIQKVLTQIEKRFKNVKNIILEYEQVLRKDQFPYHYGKETDNILKYYSNEILGTIIK